MPGRSAAPARVPDAEPLVLHWNGSAWSRKAMPAGFLPAAVMSSSTHNVWIFEASGDEALVYNGRSWHTTTVPDDLTPGAVLGASNVWGTTGSTCTGGNDATCTTTVWHWNGAAWTSSQVDGLFQGFAGAGSHAWLLLLTNLRRFSSGDPTGAPVIYRAAGATLTRITAPPPAGVGVRLARRVAGRPAMDAGITRLQQERGAAVPLDRPEVDPCEGSGDGLLGAPERGCSRSRTTVTTGSGPDRTRTGPARSGSMPSDRVDAGH